MRELRGDFSGNARSTVRQQAGDLAQSLAFSYDCIETKRFVKKVLRRDAFRNLNAQEAFYEISTVLLTDRITQNRFFSILANSSCRSQTNWNFKRVGESLLFWR